ncbi:MAG: hypothetical protein Q9184_005696 [Pyrenodesmia sp. 2 TL-2023]
MFPPVTDIKQLASTFDKFGRLSASILISIFCNHAHLFTQTHPEHLDRFLNWVRRSYARVQRGELPHGKSALAYSPAQRKHATKQLSTELGSIVEAQLINGLHVALQDNLLTVIYISGIAISSGHPQLIRTVNLLAHENPAAKTLKTGAGTGGATRLIMVTLDGRSHFKQHGRYCFTNFGTPLLSAAQEEFAQCGNIDYKPLDIEESPAKQMLHATTTNAETAQHARSLLKPGGKIVLLEIPNVHLGTHLVLGTLPDYWNGVADSRMDSPLLTNGMWQQVLSPNGFCGIGILLDDHDSPVSMASVIVATAIEPTRVDFALEQNAREAGVKLAHCSIRHSATLPPKSRIIVVADLLESFLMKMNEADLDCLGTLFQKPSSLVWDTASGLIECERPENALIVGLMRAIITEMPHVRLMTIDLEARHSQTSRKLRVADTILLKENDLQRVNEDTKAVDAE